MSERKSGILLHISSLPGAFGIGDLGPCAYHFVDFLHEAKQHYWQVLPINPTDSINEHSPYSSSSAFAGNVLFISPQLLIEAEMLTEDDIQTNLNFSLEQVDYNAAVNYKTTILDHAYDRFASKSNVCSLHQNKFNDFCRENSFWLEDYALFVTIKNQFDGVIWTCWPEALRKRDPKALEDFSRMQKDNITKIKFHQYLFFTQWRRFKNYCTEKNIQLIGDISIYLNLDSADVWAHPENYKLDDQFEPIVVAGVPPDYFSDVGQRWGNPVYNWPVLKKSKFSWWVERFQLNFELFDFVRIDHFRGLVQCWEIPAGQQTAVGGQWTDVPTMDFIETLEKRFSKPLPIIAEDLGHITEDVREVMRHFNFPGMKVLLFAFNDNMTEHPYLPHNYAQRCVVYTGTHDNNTVVGWFQNEATQKELGNVSQYLRKKVSADTVHWDFIGLAFDSIAEIAIIPMSDILGLGSEARMNRPATMDGNWRWRVNSKMFQQELVKKLSQLTIDARRD